MDSILVIIDNALRRKGLSDAAASKMAVGHPSLIKNIRMQRKGEKRYNLAALQRLADVLDLELYFGPPRTSADWSQLSQGRVLPLRGMAKCSIEGWANKLIDESPLPAPVLLSDDSAFYVRAIASSMVPEGITHDSMALVSPAARLLEGGRVFLLDTQGKASIKRLVHLDDDWLELRGWMPEENGKLQAFIDRRKRSQLAQLLPVVAVYRRELDGRMVFVPDPKSQAATPLVTIEALEPDAPLEPIGFTPEWLQSNGLTAENAALIQIPDVTMEPTLKLGDIAVINRDRTRVSGRHIYALRVDGKVMVKRLESVENHLLLLSDNAQYPTVVLDRRHQNVLILGRVMWSSHRWE